MKNQLLSHWWYNNIILLLVSGCFSHSLMGQTTYFEKQYELPSYFNSIITTDTGYIASGDAVRFQDYRPWVIYSLNLNGDTLWTKQKGEAPEAWFSEDLLSESDGFYLLGSVIDTGNITQPDIVLVRYDSNGNEIWLNRYSTPNIYDYAKKMIRLKDEGFLLVGGIVPDLDVYSNHFLVMRLDQNGNLLWKKTFEREWGIATFLSAFEFENGDIAVSGYEENAYEDFDIRVMRLSSNGDIIWQQSLGGEFRDSYTDLINNNEKSLWLIGGSASSRNTYSFRIKGVKLNSNNGMPLDSFNLQQYRRSYITATPILENDGDIVMVGTHSPNQDELGLIIKIDSLGKLLWEHTYYTDSTRTNGFYDITKTSDMGYVLAGYSFYPPDSSFSNTSHGWLLKLDCHGADSVHYYYPNTACGEPLSVVEHLRNNSPTIQVSPNPARQSAVLSSKSGEIITATTLTTMKGQKIAIPLEGIGSSKVKLDVSALPQGFYLLHITTENEEPTVEPLVVH